MKPALSSLTCGPLLPYECHEGNYGLRNILSAARAEEQKARVDLKNVDLKK